MSVETPAPELSAPPCPVSAPLPLVEELTSALDSWDVCRKLAHLPHLLFLDSASQLPALGRYSYLMADPFRWLQARSRQVRVWSASPVGGYVFQQHQEDPFSVLQQQLAQFSEEPLPSLPPFQGGAAGLFGYDLCHHIERLPRPRFDDFEIPDLAVGIYDWVIAFDHAEGRAWLISTGQPETDPGRRYQRAARRSQSVRAVLESGNGRSPGARPGPNGHRLTPAAAHPVARSPELLSSFDRDSYLATIRRAIEYVHAGDCFQVNIAQRLLCPARLPPLELYGRLRQRNPAPFAAYFDMGDFAIASASPERFLRVAGGQYQLADEVETRPIKGTRPRGGTPEQDQAYIDELRQSGKDRAENVMIVDLLRNDLGRVCRYGTVRVEDVCRIETYQYVHHLVSVIRGQLRQGKGPIDAIRAAFPGGSVTGAPKVRAMEIIAELEPVARGSYCGSLGWIGFDGSMDTNILIRTFTIGRGWVQFPVGGGIVADSVPEQEYEETWHKAEGLLRALR
jgi:para-aminobenzoate synthetase component 1